MGTMIKEWNNTTLKRFLEEGRGKGSGSEYIPWLKVQDVSRGRTTRAFGHKSQRVHHLLSDLQLHYYYHLEFDNQVTDIRENYPLLDLYQFIGDLDDNLIKRLIGKKTAMPHVFTTSFLITKTNDMGVTETQARMVKYTSELEKPAVLERLELLRRYFEKKDIDFSVITQKQIDKEHAKNLGLIIDCLTLNDYPVLLGLYDTLKQELYQYLSLPPNTITLGQIFQRMESDFQLEDGLVYIFFKHLLANKNIIMNLSKPMDQTNYPNTYYIRITDHPGGETNHAVGN